MANTDALTPKFSETIATFCGEVSVVGLRYAVLKSASWFRRISWLLLVIGGTAFTVYNVTEQVSYLLTYPTNVNIRIRSNKTLRFPTVTICNENFVRRSAAKELGFEALLTKMYPPAPSPGVTPNFTALREFYQTNNETINWGEIYYDSSQRKQEAVALCSWQQQNCDHTWFDDVITNLGSCFQFNSKNWNHISSREGSSYGLYLILNANQSDYMASYSGSAGFRILLQSPEETPLVREYAFKIAPGFDTSVGILLKKLIRLESPWGDCNGSEGYTYTGCTKQCMATHVINNCSCKEVHMPGPGRVCDPREIYECVEPTSMNYVINDLQSECACAQQCLENMYTYDSSMAPFSENAERYMSVITNGTSGSARRDYSVVTIFFSRLGYEEIKTERAYSIMTLLCDVGGALGLVLGSTLLTVCEIADFGLTQLWFIISAKKK